MVGQTEEPCVYLYKKTWDEKAWRGYMDKQGGKRKKRGRKERKQS